jgi:hypothetical protein
LTGAERVACNGEILKREKGWNFGGETGRGEGTDVGSAPSPVVLPVTRTVLNGELICIDEIAGELIWELKGQA